MSRSGKRNRPGRRNKGARQVPPQAKALLQQGVALHQAGRLQEAEQAYRRVLELDSENADGYHLLGVVAKQVGDLDAAATLLSRAIDLDDGVAAYHFNYGVALQTGQALVDAADAYRRAIRLEPRYREAYENLGVALYDLGDLKAASGAFENAIRIGDVSALAQHNLGAVKRDLGDFEAAGAHYARALELNPVYPEARLKQAQVRLAEGRFGEAWDALEWRYYSEEGAGLRDSRGRPLPVYPGEPHEPGRILVTAEQGIGDEILFASCVADLAERAEECVVECDDRLVSLFRRSLENVRVVAGPLDAPAIQALGPFDWCVPAGSLPRHFRRAAADFGQADAYLAADPEQRSDMQKRLASLPGTLKIGLSWRGGGNDRSRLARSIRLADFRWLLERDDCDIINLQYGDHEAEITADGGGLVRFDDIDPLRDMESFAALVAELDLVISVDNSTVHLAGALGTPAWVLVPTTSEWRWMGNSRTDSPWYRSLRLYHQSNKQDWKAELSALQRDLDEFEPVGPADVPVLPVETVEPEVPAAKVLLLNDTSNWYHWGCSCTSVALHEELQERHGSVASLPIQDTFALEAVATTSDQLDDERLLEVLRERHANVLDAMSSVERIVINGEGTLHGGNASALSLLTLAWVGSRHFGKPVEIINHSVYPPQELEALYRKVYEAMDRVAIREPVSAERMRALGIDVIDSFDCLPLFAERHIGDARPEKRESVTIAGSVALNDEFLSAMSAAVGAFHARGLKVELLIGAAASPASDDFFFAEALHRHCGDKFEVRNVASEVEWLDAIAASRLLVSGRFHHSIAAAWMGAPLLVLPSNTQKIAGLIDRLDLDVHVTAMDSWVVSRAEALLDDPGPGLLSDERRASLLELALRNFD